MPNPLKYQVYPNIKGIVTLNSVPVKNAIVNLTYRLNNKKGASTYTTSDNGTFFFKEKNIYSLSGILPFEDILYQKITIINNNAEYIAWEAMKDKQEEDLILTKILSSLTCELSNSETKHIINPESIFKNVIYGLARWTN